MENHPVESEPIPQLAEPRGKERVLHRHEDLAALGERRKDAFRLGIALDARMTGIPDVLMVVVRRNSRFSSYRGQPDGPLAKLPDYSIPDVRALVLQSIGLGPCSQPLPQASTAIWMFRREILLFGRIPIEIVQLLYTVANIEDVLPVPFTDSQLEAIASHVEVRARSASRVEQATPLPVGGGRQSCEVRDRRCQIDMAAYDLRAHGRLIRAREPEHERDVHILLVQRPALCVRRMRRAKRLSMIAGDDNERVLVEAGPAKHGEEASEMAIRFVQDVQIAAQIVIVWHWFAQQIEQRNAWRGHIRVMGLRGPRHHEEWTRRRPPDELDHPVHHAPIFDSPG